MQQEGFVAVSIAMIGNGFGALCCKGKNDPADQSDEHAIATKTLCYNSLRSAKGDFHPSSRIGGGGYGVVYKVPKANMLPWIGQRELLSAALQLRILHFFTRKLNGTLFTEILRLAMYCSMETLILKYGDFGLAKLFPDNVTHISTRVAGTMGCLAPEYALLGQLTKKADVYSFGILMLEIISGKSSSKAAFGENLLVLVEWADYIRIRSSRISQEDSSDAVDEVARDNDYWMSYWLKMMSKYKWF